MTPERIAGLVAWWVRVYTRNLPPSAAERRIAEIDADLHDHIEHERANGTGERRIALDIVARMLRGMAADASWRSRTIARSSTRKAQMKTNKPAHRSLALIALGTAVILLVPLVATLASDGPGWSVGDFVFAAILLAGTGLLLEFAARNPGNIVARAVAAAIGLAAIVLGEMDDAPGLMLFGGLIVVGTVALTARTAQRSE